MSPTAVLESTEWPSFVCSSLAMLRQEGVLCDTTLLGKNGRTLLAHSCILAAASPVLRTIVTQQNLVSFLHKTDFISRGVWDVILEFIYRGKVTIETVTDAHDIMVAAEKLELEKLRSLCEDFLHIEGAILKEHVDPIVLDEEPQKELHIIKIEPNLSTDVEQNLESEIDAASYANVMPPGMVQPNKPEVSTSVRIKTEPIDDAFDKQSASNITSGEGGGHESNHVGHGTGAINNQPLQTDATIYPFITPASPLVSSSMPVSQPVGRWSTAPMVTDLSRQIPVTTVPHKLPVILPDTVDATVVNSNNITQRLPLTRALLSTSQTLTTNNSAPQLSHIVVDTMLTTQMSSDNGPEEPPALVTVNHPYVSNSLVTNGCILDTCGQSGTYSSAMGVACLPVSSTVEDEGPLCLVMPKKKPPVKTRRKQRPVVVRPQITSVSSPVNPPSFHSPKSSPVGIHLTPTTGTYPTSATGQYLPSVQQQPIPTSGQQLTVVSSDLTPPPDPSNLCPTLSSYGEWRTSELKRRSANKRSKELGTITGLEAANVSPVGNTGQMSPSSIAQAEVPTAAVPLQVAAPSDGAVILEGRPVNDQQAKEQIAIEAITQLSGACSGAGAGDVMGRGRRKKTTAMKRRHPNHNGVLSSQKAPKLTIKLKTPKRQPSCSLTLGDTSQEIPESALNEDTGLQRCNVVMYDTTAVEPGATLSPPSENNPTCVPTTVLDASQLNTGSIVLKLHSARMSDERQLMRPWLEMQLTTSSIPGLHWLNPEKTLARIPWLHASRTSYQMDTDSCLFMLWAEHTGKYVPGRDEPDPKRWKANFRCALNSLADVLEVKDSSQKKGREAFKVYEFLPQTKKSRKQSTPHPNSGRKRREDTSSSGGEADTGKTGRRKQTFQSRSLTPINRATNKSPKILTGREIMSVMRRKGGVINSDMSRMINCDVLVDDTDNNVIPTAVSRMESHPTSDFTLHSHPTSDVILKPDSTSSMVPSPDLDSTRVISDAPPSVSPTDPCTQSVAADTSTHCTTETDMASPVHLQRTAGSTTPWTTGEQPKMKEEAESAAGMRMIHKGFSCRQCSQWFTHSTMLARHQLSHTSSMKAQKDTAGLGCTASAMSLAIGNQVVEQKPMQT